VNEPDLFVGLDVGTTKIAACAGRLHEGTIDVVATAESAHTGGRKGMVTDVADTASAIRAVVEALHEQTQSPVSSAVVGIGGVEVGVQESHGVAAVSRADGVITDDDLARVETAARTTTTLPANRAVLHVIPKYYTTDHEPVIQHPIGTESIRLEVTAELVSVSTLALTNLEQSVTQAGLRVDGVVFTALATANAVLSKRQLESGVILVDLGAATTDIAVFEEGRLVHAAVIPIGSQHLTNDLAIGLRTNLELAEQIKREVGSASAKGIKASDVVRLSDFDSDEHEIIKRSRVAEILEARLTELFELIDGQLKELDRNGRLPAGVVLVGNGASLDGLVEFVKATLRLPAGLGRSRLELPEHRVDSQEWRDYTTSAGLMLWGIEHRDRPSPRFAPAALSLRNVVDRARDIFKQFLP
jgi:cell division protein FtsA